MNSLVFSAPASEYVYFERWAGIEGFDICKLTNRSAYPASLAYSQMVQGVDLTQDIGNRYSVRIRSYITPAVSGSCHFRIAACQAGQLFLSANSSPGNLSM